MNRIDERFQRLKKADQKGFIVYLGGGDPDLETTRRLALAFDRMGVDVLEIGVPFSDPLADGLVNQLSAQRGLESGTTPPRLFETISLIRQEAQIPIVLYVYYNLLHRCGVEEFIKKSAAAGVDGLLVLDLPPEESGSYEELMQSAGMRHIYLLAPTTPEERVISIVKRASGFIYYVSREGVTGMQKTVSTSIEPMTALIRKHTSLPVAIGFGISTPEQAAAVSNFGDAVVVGSAIVNQVALHGKSPDLVEKVGTFVGPMIQAVKSSGEKKG